MKTATVARKIAIVLASSDGTRLRPLIERRVGHYVAKQYCTFTGTRSMLDHTLDRAACLCDRSRILTVVGRDHRKVLDGRTPHRTEGRFIEEPRDLDMGASLLLGLVHAMHRDPNATVVVFPSDQFVHPEGRFLTRMEAAVQDAERLKDRILLLGAWPADLEGAYGWIVPGKELERHSMRRVFEVESFVEKPKLASAARLYREGALWNTLIMAARARTLWDLACERLSDLASFFAVLQPAIGTSREAQVLDELYAEMPRVNFSTAVLTRPFDRVAVQPLHDVLWSDWEQPDRIVESLLAIGKPGVLDVRASD